MRPNALVVHLLANLLGSACAFLVSAHAADDARGANGADEPSHWTPPAIATDRYESSPAFTPDGRELYFMSSSPSFENYRLLWTRCEDGRWAKPEPVPFAAPEPAIEADPFVTQDGKRLYFISARHDPKNEDFDIWFVERDAQGRWGAAHRLPAPVNSPGAELWPRVDASGTIVFGSSRDGGFGGGDIYRAIPGRDGRWRVENFGPPVSTAAWEYEAEISRDGRVLVVVADRGDRSHLYVYDRADSARRKSDAHGDRDARADGDAHGYDAAHARRWVERVRVPARREVFQVGPLLSPRADRLLFAQADGTRSGELFLFDLAPRPDRTWPPGCAR